MKAMMAWSETMSVGDAEIDEQHRVLIGILNSLYDAMLEGRARQMMDQLFEDLASYMHLHFSNEEQYFDQFHYAGRTQHVLQHQELTRKTQELQTTYFEKNRDMTMELFSLLRDWIIRHIMQEDMKYRSFFKQIVRQEEDQPTL